MAIVWPSLAEVEQVDVAEAPTHLVHLAALTAAITSRLLTAPARTASPVTKSDGLLDATTVAARLGVRKGYVYHLCRIGKLAHIRHGKYVRVSEQSLAGFLAAHTEVPRQSTQQRRRAG